jgi:hypothetical protein
VSLNPNTLWFASERLRDSEEVVRFALSLEADVFQFASDRLKNTEGLVRFAMGLELRTLRFASDRLKDDEAFVFDAILGDVRALEYVSGRSKNLLAIRKGVLEAVQANWRVLEQLPTMVDHLLDDEEVILHAIRQCGWALSYASDRLKDKENVVCEAVRWDPYVLVWASERLKKSDEFKIHFQDGAIQTHAKNIVEDDEQLARQLRTEPREKSDTEYAVTCSVVNIR